MTYRSLFIYILFTVHSLIKLSTTSIINSLTVLKVQQNVDISGAAFKRDTEAKLAQAYSEAFIRQQLIREGKFEPLQRRRRRKRYAAVGDVGVHVCIAIC